MSTSSVPQTMSGVQMDSFGGTEVLKYKPGLPVPTPQNGQILVKNDFIGVNYADTYWRIGMMGPVPDGILGREAEGTVVSVGPGAVNSFKVGDRVVWLAMGGYAEYASVPASMAFAVPPNIEPGIAAAALIQGLTALNLVHRLYQVQKGDWTLVHAAAGGTGLWLCQLISAIGGKTIGTASTTDKIQLAKQNGADFVINYREEKDLVKRVLEITQGQGVNVVYDGVGKAQAENNVKVVARNGTIITYGAASGMPSPPSPVDLAAKNIRLVGPSESALMKALSTPQEFERACSNLFATIVRDKVKARIHGIYPLSDVVRAHEDLEGRKTTGKILLKP